MLKEKCCQMFMKKQVKDPVLYSAYAAGQVLRYAMGLAGYGLP